MTTSCNIPRADGRHPVGGTTLRRLTRAIRGLMIAGILICSCYLAYGFGNLWADWRRASQPITPQLSDAGLAASPVMVLPLAGRWSFAELDWSLRSNAVAINDVAAHFQKLASMPAQRNADSLPEVSPELVRLVERVNAEPLEQDGNRIYRLDQPQLKAQLVLHPANGQFKAVSLAAAYWTGDDEWQLLDFSPAAGANVASASCSSLLPLPARSKRCGGRFTDDGRALLELIAVDTNASELLANWREAGWECRPSGFGDPKQFSFLCVRGGEVIYAWSADPLAAMNNLMLVRTPAPGDTTP